MKKFLLSMAGILSMLAITACHDTEVIQDNKKWDTPADHTLLMYLVGDNSLSSLIETNVRDAQRAILDSVYAGTINLVVMKDNDRSGDSYPSLYWVHANAKMQLDTVRLKTWYKEENTASTAFLADVLDVTFSKFNTKIKGLSLGSHAMGWVPLTNSNNYSAPPRPAFGTDENVSPVASIELWDLGATLKQGPKLDYILMDCCHMAGVEVAYELRDVADYMVACPTEEEGAGLPYLKIVPALARVHSASDLPATLNYAAKCYFDNNKNYQYGATISVIDLREMTNLGNMYRQLLSANSQYLAHYAQADGMTIDAWVKNLQRYGREVSNLHNLYYFYDILSLTEMLSEADATAASRVTEAVNKAVIAKYATAEYRNIKITKYSGMSVSIPEILHLANRSWGYSSHFHPFDDKKLLTGYHLTEWGRDMGY